MSKWGAPEWKTLEGQKVIAVDGATVFLEDGRAFMFDLDGDCCSSSDYTPEGLAAFAELPGATIASIEERNGTSTDGLEEKYPASDVDSWHFLVITTNKGHVTIDWRNSSNGYYDGTCFLVEAKPLHPVVNDAILEGRGVAEVRAMIDAQTKVRVP